MLPDRHRIRDRQPIRPEISIDPVGIFDVMTVGAAFKLLSTCSSRSRVINDVRAHFLDLREDFGRHWRKKHGFAVHYECGNIMLSSSSRSCPNSRSLQGSADIEGNRLFGCVIHARLGCVMHRMRARPCNARLPQPEAFEIGLRSCISSIVWDESGSRLLTGSDDCAYSIHGAAQRRTDDAPYELRARLQTGQTGNIFSARFVPDGTARRVVTCSENGSIRLTGIERTSEVLHYIEQLG